MAPIMFNTTNIPNFAELMKKNEELEREVSKEKAREKRMKEELERTRVRLKMVKEAEERLCSELRDLEAEAFAQPRDYQLRIKYLTNQLTLDRKIPRV